MSPCLLTNLVNALLSAQPAYRGQIKVVVLVNQGDLPVIGGSALVKSNFHHLHLRDGYRRFGEREKLVASKPNFLPVFQQCQTEKELVPVNNKDLIYIKLSVRIMTGV